MTTLFSIKKLGSGASLVFAGMVLGALAVVALLFASKPSPEEIAEAQRRDTVAYIKAEQLRQGVDCSKLTSNISSFLESQVQPIEELHRPGRNWYKDVTQDAKKQIEKLRDDYSTCERLSIQARNEGVRGLVGFVPVEGLETQLVIVYTVMRNEFCAVNNLPCMDQSFEDLQGAANAIRETIAKQRKQTAQTNGVRLHL